MTTRSTTERIKHIQRFLNLQPDGIIGSDTLTAIENRLFDNKDDLDKVYSLTISRTGMEQLVQHEIVSKTYYNRFLKKPIWPGGASGVTIGIGYDLGYNRVAQIRKDWRGKIADADLEKLTKVSGLKGENAKKALGQVKSVSISFDGATQVFSESTLPRYAASTRKAYPGIELLLPDAQSALLSLVYNRGASMSGSRRKEMAAIKPLVERQDYPAIAQQIINMKRLWEGKGLAGLLKRRDEEAELVLNAGTDYDEADLIRV
jgi:GH24 family phage-related lysozyme (muramidase)